MNSPLSIDERHQIIKDASKGDKDLQRLVARYEATIGRLEAELSKWQTGGNPSCYYCDSIYVAGDGYAITSDLTIKSWKCLVCGSAWSTEVGR